MRPTGVNGVLPASVLQKNPPPSAPRGPKAAQPRLKLVLRRLPPGLTKAEFSAILGDEWKQGGGKVDWLEYIEGKVSKDPAKPSRPSRAYIHVTSQQHLAPLGDHVRNTSFNDAARTFQDSALIGPPTLEFAVYPKVPGGRRKHDVRQGTIDQDPEFKDFLVSLTAPITKPSVPEGEQQKEAKVTTTPLIEALREKKANKDKPQKTAKHGRGETKDDSADKTDKKILSKHNKEATPAVNEKGRRATKAEKAAKEAVKALTKEVSQKKEPAAANDRAGASPAPERKRANVNIAKTLLQRDLGLVPASSRRRGTKRDVASSATSSPATTTENASAAKQRPEKASVTPSPSEKTVPASPKKSSRSERRAVKAGLSDKTNRNPPEEVKQEPKGSTTPAPTILKKPERPQASSTPTAPKGPPPARAPPTEPAAARATAQHARNDTNATRPQTSAVPAPSAAPMGRQAFLKHANPSQGISEPLIEEALKVFGAIEKVEIDKRKGFAYVDFADPEGLRKAIAASPVKVAQGAVQVLEKRDKVVRNRPHPMPHNHGPPTGPARGARGGGFAPRGRGRGGVRGGAHTGPAPATAEGAATPARPAAATTPGAAT
ncbi:hypothetical protein M011DRAFT_471699 [Sporormia fimetaria CBS 119925]|uniref:RRM domain-containing protein n=1 Tax=Sporormia fimetaria CBS 119925 TaxID=1340428 RepID=A0A6A6V0I2_9PLEO|nr:hypothetical protein M011DRAFT_471699 [Sporormia fimetaria CBS 119925]